MTEGVLGYLDAKLGQLCNGHHCRLLCPPNTATAGGLKDMKFGYF